MDGARGTRRSAANGEQRLWRSSRSYSRLRGWGARSPGIGSCIASSLGSRCREHVLPFELRVSPPSGPLPTRIAASSRIAARRRASSGHQAAYNSVSDADAEQFLSTAAIKPSNAPLCSRLGTSTSLLRSPRWRFLFLNVAAPPTGVLHTRQGNDALRLTHWTGRIRLC